VENVLRVLIRGATIKEAKVPQKYQQQENSGHFIFEIVTQLRTADTLPLSTEPNVQCHQLDCFPRFISLQRQRQSKRSAKAFHKNTQ
jgi:hypothetical protein